MMTIMIMEWDEWNGWPAVGQFDWGFNSNEYNEYG